MKKTLLMLATAAAVAVPTLAQAEPFNGGYVGAQVGWNRNAADINFGVAGIPNFDESSSGIAGGLFAGYDAKIGDTFVVGGEVDFGIGGKTLSASPLAGSTVSIDPKWNYGLTARAGFLAAENTLFYVRGGYSAERLEIREQFAAPNAGLNSSETGWSDGWQLGGGVEFAVNEQISLRGEYRYHNLDGDYTKNQFMVGASFRF